jgi:uncharacterized membrane protein YoaK (UPF0700 family)
VLGYFRNDVKLAVSAGVLVLCFVAGVVVASICRRRFWSGHPHGPTVLTTFSLLAATVLDVIDEGWEELQLDFTPIMLVTFGVGALNTSFVKDGEVSVPLSYVTGTLVKMGQGIERHIAGGTVSDWLGYFLLLASFVAGATLGGVISVIINGMWMLAAATLLCALTTAFTYLHTDRVHKRGALATSSAKRQRQQR